MIKILLFLLLFIQVQSASCQQYENTENTPTGLVIYQQKVDLRVYIEKLDTLKFNRTKSLFSWNLYPSKTQIPEQIKRSFPNAKIPENKISLTGQVNFYDTNKDSLYSRKSMRHLNAVLYLKEKTPSINWTITDSTKKVGNYFVQKATTSFRGRDYTAWFAPEIPVPFGPWKLHGLPGLILQAYDRSGNIYFSTTKISLVAVGPVGPIKLTGEEQIITLDEYRLIMNKFDKKMRAKALKTARRFFSSEEMADVKINIPEVELMETFKNGNDQ